MNSVRIFFYNANSHASFADAMAKFNAGDKTAVTQNGSYIEPDMSLSNIQDIREVIIALNEMHAIASGSNNIIQPSINIVAMVVDDENNAVTLDQYIEYNI